MRDDRREFLEKRSYLSSLGALLAVSAAVQIFAGAAEAQPRRGWGGPGAGQPGTVVVPPAGQPGTVVVVPAVGTPVASCVQGSREVCDGIDNNCNGFVDEECVAVGVPVGPGQPPIAVPVPQPPIAVPAPQPPIAVPVYPQPGYPQPGYPGGGQVLSYDQPQMIQGFQVLRLRQLLNIGPQFDGQMVQSVEVDAASQFGGTVSLVINGMREASHSAYPQLRSMPFNVGRVLGRNYGEIQTLQLEVQNVFIRSIRVRMGWGQPGGFERRDLQVSAPLQFNQSIALDNLISPMDRGRTLVQVEIQAQPMNPQMGSTHLEVVGGGYPIPALQQHGYGGQMTFVATVNQTIGMGGIHPRMLRLQGSNVFVTRVTAVLR